MKISICYWNRYINILKIKYKRISSANNNPLINKNKLLIKIIMQCNTEKIIICTNPLYHTHEKLKLNRQTHPTHLLVWLAIQT